PLEIPQLPPAPVQTASGTSVAADWQAKGAEKPSSLDMIAPPPFEDMNVHADPSMHQNYGVPVQAPELYAAVPQDPFGGDIGSDPFVQTACQISPDGWGTNSCNTNCCDSDYCQNGQYCCDLCPNPDPCGIFEPYISGEVWLGNRRVIAGGGFFIPLWQDCESLVFTDLQGRGDDHGAGDGYFGLGYRRYMDPNVIFGTYLYYDLRASNQGNYYNQASLGFELISLDWEFRINGYFPGSSGRSANQAFGYSNGTVVTRNFQERAYRGLDWEIGHRFMYWGWNDKYEVRWFLGSYHFDHSSSNSLSFAGPRARLEMRINDLGWMGNQSRLTFGMETSTDRIRNEQIFGFARIQIPFGGGQKGERDYLDPLRRRMLDAPVRPLK
ncbi:MAG TPA: inverse autotransporter beta domain-containing protein, partial [Planctomicrobium sp.]|nr:inverse autotransporter beta domain-containing protein [Planctomicrobium sp.]